jgi:hypothetical protein
LFAQEQDGRGLRTLLKQRWALYTGLAATWLLLVATVWSEQRPGAVGFGFAAWPWWRYLATEAGVILHYLKLALVPFPLVLDYGWPPANSVAASLPQIAAIASLAALTLFGSIGRRPAAFPGVLFFLVLAPTSSVLPIVTEVAAEHRMYLPLASVITLLVTAAF